MRRKLNSWYITLFLSICMFGGCSKQPDPSPTVKPSSTAAPAPTTAKSAASVQGAISSGRLNTVAKDEISFKKDPFKPLITEPDPAAAKNGQRNKPSGINVLPIQTHAVGDFIVAGIVTGLRENKALIVDPAGKAYVVKTGMLIGDNNGRISKITASTLEVTERYTDEKKRIRSRNIVLPLAKKNKEISR